MITDFWTPHLFSLTVWRWILVPAAVSAFAFLLALMVFLLVNAYFVHFQVPTYLFDSFGRRRSWGVQLFSYLQTSRLVLSPFMLSSRSVGRENIWHLALSFFFLFFPLKKMKKLTVLFQGCGPFIYSFPLYFFYILKKKNYFCDHFFLLNITFLVLIGSSRGTWRCCSDWGIRVAQD